MKRVYWSALLTWIAITAVLVTPVLAAQNGTVTASAVIVPAQVIDLGFLSSAIVKEVNVKVGDAVKAGQTLAVLDTPELQYNVTAAQEAYHVAQADANVQRYNRVLHYRNGRKYWDMVPPEVRQMADARAWSAQARMEIAQALFAQSTLVAPADATVAAVNVIPGEYVNQNQVAVKLATLNTLQVETTDLGERDIASVKVEAPVQITVEALKDSFTGKVISISPVANNVGGDVVFKVTIAFDQQPKGLLWGMSAEVQIGG